MAISAPELLNDTHDLSAFCCGIDELDNWLARQGLKSQVRNHAKVYVVSDTNTQKTVGYYAVAMGSVRREEAIAKMRRNSPDPIPMLVLARLAVDKAYHGYGIGAGLLKDCVLRSVQAAKVVGGAGILVHAINPQARTFYKKFGFSESPIHNMTLMTRICDIEASIK